MQLPVSQNTNLPGQILLNNYLKPKGISVSEFSKISGIDRRTLQASIEGCALPYSAIQRISYVTRTAPRYWHYLQVTWQFHEYLKCRKPERCIEPISSPWRTSSFESPGQILSREFLKPSGESYRSIERKYKIQYPPLYDIVRGRKAITPLLAAKFQLAFGASTRYWLDLQACHDISKITSVNSEGYKSIQVSIEKFRNDLERRKFTLESEKEICVHPGKILLRQFMKPSGMSVIEWQKILFIQMGELKLILAGKRRLTAKMIVKLSRVLNIDVTYWIDLNNRYYSKLADAQCRRLLKKVEHKPVRIQHQPPAPFEFLENNFLRPVDFPRKRFLRHIGVKGRSYGDDFRVVPRISYDLAFKVGQALQIDPQYFIFLQMEYNIHLQENRGRYSKRPSTNR